MKVRSSLWLATCASDSLTGRTYRKGGNSGLWHGGNCIVSAYGGTEYSQSGRAIDFDEKYGDVCMNLVPRNLTKTNCCGDVS
jgi:hypothetical protein